MSKIPHTLSLEPRIFGCSSLSISPNMSVTNSHPVQISVFSLGMGLIRKAIGAIIQKPRQVITTMNCTFLETEFFYATQLPSQGEKEINTVDLISWLPMPNNHSSTEGLPEPTTSVAEHAMNTPQPMELGDTPTVPVPITEVTNPENSVNICTDNVATEGEEREIIDEDTGQYIRPIRSTRGIPPKR